jgi:hypothetical protein
LPEESTVPPSASNTDHITSVLAVNATVPSTCTDATSGEIETVIPRARAMTVAVPITLSVLSAALFAITWYVPDVASGTGPLRMLVQGGLARAPPVMSRAVRVISGIANANTAIWIFKFDTPYCLLDVCD